MVKVKLPLYLTWKALKQVLGWPNGRTQTWRMMKKEILRTKGSRRNGTYREWVEPNPDPFPACTKFNNFRNCHPVWYTPDVLAWLKRHGLPVPENIEFS